MLIKSGIMCETLSSVLRVVSLITKVKHHTIWMAYDNYNAHQQVRNTSKYFLLSGTFKIVLLVNTVLNDTVMFIRVSLRCVWNLNGYLSRKLSPHLGCYCSCSCSMLRVTHNIKRFEFLNLIISSFQVFTFSIFPDKTKAIWTHTLYKISVDISLQQTSVVINIIHKNGFVQRTTFRWYHGNKAYECTGIHLA